MDKTIFFGKYSVPPISENNLSASYTAPINLNKEELKKIKLSDFEQFDNTTTELIIKNFNEGIKEYNNTISAFCIY